MRYKVIAICGKGGVGKTTVSAIIAQALAQRPNARALLVDADPAGGLGMALGLAARRTVNDVRRDTIDEIKRGESDKKDLVVSLDYRLMEVIAERGNLAFLPIGRPEELGCYCAVNTLLREAIELLADKFDLVIIDAEAGIEQVNRQALSAVDYLLLVSDTSAKGIRVAETIKDVAEKNTEQLQTGLLLNRVIGEGEVTAIAAKTQLEVIGWLPEDEAIRRFDAEEISFFNLPDCPAADAVIQALKQVKILI